jgi:hypothetical protein
MRRRIANGKQRNINRAEDGLEPIKQASGSLLCPHGHGLICTERKTERTGAVTGDPAASSHNANPDTTGMGPNKAGVARPPRAAVTLTAIRAGTKSPKAT